MHAAMRLAWTIVAFAVLPAVVLAIAYGALRGDPGVDALVVDRLISATWVILFASIGLPLILTALAIICGDRRWLLSLIFPPLTLVSVVSLACLLVLQGAALIIVTGLYAEAHHGAGMGIRIALAVALGVLATTFALIGASVKMLSPMRLDASGIVLRSADSPRLFQLINALAARLGSPAPSQIVLGLEPTFYVTMMPVKLVETGDILRGETLYLSAPLSRLLSEHEFSAVIGHELGHFRGKDTVYSRRFAPAFSALDHAIVSMSGREGEPLRVLALPALITLGLLYDIFAVNVAKVSRKRELEADRAGAECATNRDIATALLKATWYDERWELALDRNAKRLTELTVVENLSAEFRATEGDHPADLAVLMLAVPNHPVDSHPPLAERLQALGFSESSFDARDVAPAVVSAASYIDDLEGRETALTLSLHLALIAYRHGPLGERDQRATLLRAAALLGASFALHGAPADLARDRGRAVMSDFDTRALDAFLSSPASLPRLAVAADIVGSLVSDEGRYTLLRYLNELVEAVPSLKESLALVRRRWGTR